MSPDIEWDDILALVRTSRIPELKLHNYQLKDEKLRELADALAGNTSIRSVDLGSNHITDATAALLAKSFKTMPQLRRIMMVGNHIGAPGIRSLVKELRGHPNLLQFNLAGMNANSTVGSPYTRPETEAWREGMKELLNTCPNLTMLPDTISLDVSDMRREKSLKLKQWHEGLGSDVSSALVLERYGSAMEELTLHGRTRVHSAESFRRVQQDWQEILGRNAAFINTLPQYDPAKPITLDRLLDEDALCYRLLDNPRNWDHFAGIADALAAQGTPIEKSMLLEKNAEGIPYLEIAGILGKLPEALAALNAQGEQVDAKDLLNIDGSPNRLMKALIEVNAAPALFTYDQCEGQSPHQIRRLHNALPSYQQQEVPLHGILAAIGRNHAAGMQR